MCERAERARLENVVIFTILNCYFFQYFVGTTDTLSVQMACLSAYMYRQISKYTNANIEQMYVYASELRKCWHFYILKLLFLSMIFCRNSRYFVGTNDMLVDLHVPTNFLIYRQTLTLSKCMCMRASGASELRKCWHFYILNLLFLSIFCRYIRYFVGTKWHACRLTCTDKFPNVPTTIRKSITPSSGYANVYY